MYHQHSVAKEGHRQVATPGSIINHEVLSRRKKEEPAIRQTHSVDEGKPLGGHLGRLNHSYTEALPVAPNCDGVTVRPWSYRDQLMAIHRRVLQAVGYITPVLAAQRRVAMAWAPVNTPDSIETSCRSHSCSRSSDWHA
jgi:hypothetical protein